MNPQSRRRPSNASTTTIKTNSASILADFVSAYNFGRRLRPSKVSHPMSSSAKSGQTNQRFSLNPIHQMPGLTPSLAGTVFCVPAGISHSALAQPTASMINHYFTADEESFAGAGYVNSPAGCLSQFANQAARTQD